MGEQQSKSLAREQSLGRDRLHCILTKGQNYYDEKKVGGLELNRIQGHHIKSFPHCLIVAIRWKISSFNLSIGYGSGVLISPQMVLTCAHNIFDKKYKKEYQKQDYQIFVEANGIAEQFYEVEDWRFPEEFKTCEMLDRSKFDYAVIKLKRPITYNNFMKISLPCECIINRQPHLQLQIYGYPIKYTNYVSLNKSMTKFQLFQYGLTLNNSILRISFEDKKILYGMTTYQGQSGCPVVIDNQIIAIHIGSGIQGEKWNLGRLVTIDLIQRINQWTKQLRYFPLLFNEHPLCVHQKITQSSQLPQINFALSKQLDYNSIAVQKQQKINSSRKNKQTGIKLVERNIIEMRVKAQKLEKSADKLKDQSKFEHALEQYKKSIAIYEQLHGKNSKEVAAILIYGIGKIYRAQGKYSLALEAFERGKAISLEKEGVESHNYAVSLERIGDVYRQRAEHDVASYNYKKALKIWQKTKGRDSLEAGITIDNIGFVFLDKEDYPQALYQLKWSLQIYERAGKGNSIKAATIHNNFGAIYSNQKEYSFALHHYIKALEIYQSSSPDTGRATASRMALSIYEQMDLSDQVKKSSHGLAKCLSRLDKKEELEMIIEKYGVKRSEI